MNAVLFALFVVLLIKQTTDCFSVVCSTDIFITRLTVLCPISHLYIIKQLPHTGCVVYDRFSLMKYFVVVMCNDLRFTRHSVHSVPKNGTLVKMLTELTTIKLSINGSHVLTLEVMFIDIFVTVFENSGTNGIKTTDDSQFPIQNINR